MPALRSLAPVLLILAAATNVSAQTFTGTIDNSDPLMVQVSPTATLCTDQGSSAFLRHDALPFSPLPGGRYTISLESPTPQFLDFAVYKGPFDPMHPRTNCIAAANTALEGTRKQVSRVLEATASYVLVVFDRTVTQASTVPYSITVSGPFYTPADFSGDGFSELAVVELTGGTMTWWSHDPVLSALSHVFWGTTGDIAVPGDYDGDRRTDAAIWRPGAAGTAGFWIKQSSDGAVAFLPFGQNGDDPTIVGDYDGDGKTDIAVFRAGASPGAANNWIHRRSSDGALAMETWGEQGEAAAPGDYDGDGKADLAVRRMAGGFAQFWMKQSTAGEKFFYWGEPTDRIVPGDFDADGKTDMTVTRVVSGALVWWQQWSSHRYLAGRFPTFGLPTDLLAPAAYDPDGRTEIGVWRDGIFWVLTPSGTSARFFGTPGSVPLAGFNIH